MKVKLFFSGLMLIIFALALNAQEPQGQNKCKGKADSSHCKHHVMDSSKCKHHGQDKGHVKGDMKGCCKEHNKNCKHFTDANKDGICDHVQDSTSKK